MFGLIYDESHIIFICPAIIASRLWRQCKIQFIFWIKRLFVEPKHSGTELGRCWNQSRTAYEAAHQKKKPVMTALMIAKLSCVFHVRQHNFHNVKNLIDLSHASRID